MRPAAGRSTWRNPCKHEEPPIPRSLITLLLVGCVMVLLPLRSEATGVEAALEASPLTARTVRTIDRSDLGVERPTGVTYDPAARSFLVSGQVDGRRSTVTLDSFWEIVAVDRSVPGRERSSLTAVNPWDGRVYVLDPAVDTLTARDSNDAVVAVYDTGGLGLVSAEAMVFAPSTDVTDDPGWHNLFVADSGDAAWDGGVTEVTVEQPPSTFSVLSARAEGVALTAEETALVAALTIENATLVQSFTTDWSPPATDPSGITWNPNTARFIVSDSEINEIALFAGVNLWFVGPNGNVLGTGATTGPSSAGISDEPTGVGYNAARNEMYVTDDTGTRSVYVVQPGSDGAFGTTDDSFVQIPVPPSDPEDPEFHVNEGVLYFLGGTDREIYRLDPVDSQFGNGNDVLTSFDIGFLGPTDFEGLSIAPNRGTLYVGATSEDFIFEITTTGALIRTIPFDIDGLGKVSGLAVAPSSTDPTVSSLWVVDRGADEANDGDMWELSVSSVDDPPAGNSAPFAIDDVVSTSQDLALAVDVLGNDFDANGDPLVVDSVTDPVNGGVMVNPDETVTYTPDVGFVGDDSFTYRAFDGTAHSNVATVTVTVTGPNQPPTAVDDAVSTSEGTSVTADVLANDTDVHDDPLTVDGVSSAASGSVVINADDTITYTPNPGFFGTDSFTYDVCDLEPLCDTGTVTVTVMEGQPLYYVSVDSSTSLPGVGGTIRDEDIVVYDATMSTWELFFDASDVGITSSDLDAFHIRGDGSILISYSSDGLVVPGMTGGPNGEVVDESDLFLFTPTSTGETTAGSFSFYFDGSDVGLEDSGEDVVGVFEFDDGSLGISTKGAFDVPGLTPGDQEDIHRFSGGFGSATSGTWSLFFDGSDVGFTTSDDLDGISFAGDLYFTTEPAYNAAGGTGADEDISRFSGSFGDSTSGIAALEFDASTAGLDPTLVVDAIHVANIDDDPPPINTPPTLDPIGDQSGDEATTLSFAANANDSDLPAQTLTFDLSGAPVGASINPSGVFTWTPTESQGPGSYTFDVVVTDDGSPNLSDSQSVTITVNEVNLAPTANAGADQVAFVGEAVTFDGTASADPDVPIQTLTYTWMLDSTPAASIATLAGETTTSPTLTPDVAGTYVISLVVDDGVATSFADTVTLIATAQNAAPVLDEIGARSGDELTVISFTATASDPDVPAQSLTFSLSGGPPGASIDPITGVFAWTPTETQDGIHAFDVVVTDDGAVPQSDSESITVTVNEVNVAPVLAPIGDRTVDEGTELVFSATAGDSDEPVQTLAFSLSGAPAGATIDPVSGAFSWTPTETQDGIHTFEVVVTDDATPALGDAETITVTVNDVNNAPTLDPIGDQTAAEGNEVSFVATAGDTDLPAQTLTFSLSGAPTGASIDATTGAFTWTPSEVQDGIHIFDVVVTDDGTPNLSSQETVTVTVNEVNVAPVLAPIAGPTGDELAPIGFLASATDADLPAQALTFSLAGAPAAASIDPDTGMFTWTPTEADGPGVYVFDVLVTDDGTPSLSTSRPVTVTVEESDAAPILDPIGDRTATAGIELSFTATASDSDIPVETLTFSLSGEPAGAVIHSSTGVFTWTPTGSQSPGVYSFDVVVADATGLSDFETITVNVSDVVSGPVYYLSVSSTTSVPGIAEAVRDEDIVAYDAATDAWSMFFDASDVGINSSDLNAFHIRGDGSILISYSSDDLSIPGLVGGPNGDLIDDSDIILFTPSSTGDDTAGEFTFYFDGSDVGLESDREDIDGLIEFADGSLGISTTARMDVGYLPRGSDEDVHRFSGSFGSDTSGTWSLHFDGSDVGLTDSEADLNAISIDGDAHLLFSTIGTFVGAGGGGDDEDVNRFTGTFGGATTGTATLELDGSAVGLDAGANIDALHFDPGS